MTLARLLLLILVKTRRSLAMKKVLLRGLLLVLLWRLLFRCRWGLLLGVPFPRVLLVLISVAVGSIRIVRGEKFVCRLLMKFFISRSLFHRTHQTFRGIVVRFRRGSRLRRTKKRHVLFRLVLLFLTLFNCFVANPRQRQKVLASLKRRFLFLCKFRCQLRITQLRDLSFLR